MPTTRSASTAKSSSSRVDATLSEVGDLRDDDLESHLSALQHGIRDLRKTREDLLARNRRLQGEIDRLHNQPDVSVQPTPVKSGGRSNSLQMKVEKLELKVRQLKKAHALDRKKIRQLRLREAHKDAEELQDEEVHGVPDVEHEMKKLLRNFYRVVSSPSLEEQEECSICVETMELNKCSSLPCQHIFCDSCLSKIGDGENISCPQCRGESNVESIEVVEFTATQQWDQLLEIARQFAALEDRLGPDTSEEEEEEKLRENFIDDEDDEDVEASTSSESLGREITPDTMAEGVPNQDEDEEGGERPCVPYSRSGVVEKRRRMEELAARKRRR
ncbi:hypothetical protein EDB85DRAFT_2104443 [Lactarius pseudohatsudake]|nr:hypothetical protein EDB85DRAFT_2104443 [Lactarius pseudohatsudake]